MYDCTLDSAISEAIIRSTACLRACFPSCCVHWISTLGASELSAFSLSSWIFTLPVSMEMHCLDSCVVFGFNRILPKRCRISTRYSLWVILWGPPPPHVRNPNYMQSAFKRSLGRYGTCFEYKTDGVNSTSARFYL